jgi:hypothetical protein
VLFWGGVIWLVMWMKKKLKGVAKNQEVWATTVEQLGGKELEQRGRAGTRAFRLPLTGDGALLAAVTHPSMDANVVGEVRQLGAVGVWHSHLLVPLAKEGGPCFEICALPKERGAVATGNPEFDARYSVIPKLGADSSTVLALCTPEVMAHLLRLKGYQFVSGGKSVAAFRAGIVDSAEELKALVLGAKLLAGHR